MKCNLKTVVTTAVCGLLLLPNVSHAGTATILTDTIALFTTEITVDKNSFDVELPIIASSSVTYTDRVDIIGMAVENSDGEQAKTATVTSLLLGRAAIEDIRYSIAAGMTTSFTLVTLVEFAEPITESYTVRVSKLPYWNNGRRTTMHQNQLDELDTATTKLQ